MTLDYDIQYQPLNAEYFRIGARMPFVSEEELLMQCAEKAEMAITSVEEVITRSSTELIALTPELNETLMSEARPVYLTLLKSGMGNPEYEELLDLEEKAGLFMSLPISYEARVSKIQTACNMLQQIGGNSITTPDGETLLLDQTI